MAGVRFALLLSKFRGGIAGAVIGDTLGTEAVSSCRIPGHDVVSQGMRPIGESLLSCHGYNRDDLIKRLSSEDPMFGKTGELPERKANDTTVLRTVPIAMYYYGSLSRAVAAVRDASHLDSLHRPKDNGDSSVLHSIALHQAMQFDPVRPLNVDLFLDEVITGLAEAGELETSAVGGRWDVPHMRKLQKMRQLLTIGCPTADAVYQLEHDSPEKSSVLAAIFTFLRERIGERQEVDSSPVDRILQESMKVCSQLGEVNAGRLPTLACNLSGAYHGIESIPDTLRQQCPSFDLSQKFTDKLALHFEAIPGREDETRLNFLHH